MDSYDCIICGSSFAGTFFLYEWLKHAPKNSRVLVLERGNRDSHQWQYQNQRNSSIPPSETFINKHPHKVWAYTPGFGGSSNCWTGNTPRMMPNDFKMQSRYGVGQDWPLSYEDLEAATCEVESIMSISGPDITPYPRSCPHPQKAHRLSDPDKILQRARPDVFLLCLLQDRVRRRRIVQDVALVLFAIFAR